MLHMIIAKYILFYEYKLFCVYGHKTIRLPANQKQRKTNALSMQLFKFIIYTFRYEITIKKARTQSNSSKLSAKIGF